MKSFTSVLFLSLMFIVGCTTQWKPSIEELSLSAREDARDAAMAEIVAKYQPTDRKK